MIARRGLLLSVVVLRFRIWLVFALAFGAIIAGLLRAQVNEQRQRDRSEETETRAASSPKPKKSPTPVGKAKATTHRPSPSPKTKRRHTPTPKPTIAKKKSSATEASEKTKKTAKSKSDREEEDTPRPQKTPSPRLGEERAASENAAPPSRAAAAPTPTPAPQPNSARAVSPGGQAQVVIEKSGIEEDQGFEPPPSPPPRHGGFWPWSRPVSYRYLTSSARRQVGNYMKTGVNTALDPTRRSNDAQTFELPLRRKIVGQDLANSKRWLTLPDVFGWA